MVKKLLKDIQDMAKVGVVGSVSANVVTRAGGNANSISNATRYLPSVGRVKGAQAVLRTLKKKRKWRL